MVLVPIVYIVPRWRRPENKKRDAAILPRHRQRQGLTDGRHLRLHADFGAVGHGRHLRLQADFGAAGRGARRSRRLGSDSHRCRLKLVLDGLPKLGHGVRVLAKEHIHLSVRLRAVPTVRVPDEVLVISLRQRLQKKAQTWRLSQRTVSFHSAGGNLGGEQVRRLLSELHGLRVPNEFQKKLRGIHRRVVLLRSELLDPCLP